jgi:hypothetical protein
MQLPSWVSHVDRARGEAFSSKGGETGAGDKIDKIGFIVVKIMMGC